MMKKLKLVSVGKPVKGRPDLRCARYSQVLEDRGGVAGKDDLLHVYGFVLTQAIEDGTLKIGDIREATTVVESGEYEGKPYKLEWVK